MSEYWWIPVAGCFLGLVCLVPAFRQGRRQRLVDDVPTSKTTGVFIGLAELKGTAECESPVSGFLSGEPCVHYSWDVEERWKKIITETTTDSEGRKQTKTREESGWKVVASGGEMVPFDLKDDYGSVLVRPYGAEIQPSTLFSQTCSPGDPLYFEKGPKGELGDSEHVRRFTESGIPLHEDVYVIGQARERKDIVAAEIASDPNEPIFLISTNPEEKVSSGLKWWGRSWVFFGLVFSVAGFLIWNSMEKIADPAVVWTECVAAAAGYIGVWSLSWVWMSYNSLVDLRQRVRQGRSQIDVQLKRRHDLIPNLVESAKAFATHEQDVQTSHATLRAQASASPFGGPDGSAYQSAARTGKILLEKYTDLKANELFLKLQKDLADTEDRISLARGYYNDIATHFNSRIQTVPDNFVACLGRMQPFPLCEIDEKGT